MRELMTNCVIGLAEDGTGRIMVYGPLFPNSGGPYARCVFSRTSTQSTLWTLRTVEAWGVSVREVSYIWRVPIAIRRNHNGQLLPVQRKPYKDKFAKVFILQAPFYTTRRELTWR